MTDRKKLKQDALHIIQRLVDKQKYILDEKAVWFVEDRGKPVAVALGYPDINVLINEVKGKINPLTFIKFIRHRKTIRDYMLWGLAVLPGSHLLTPDR